MVQIGMSTSCTHSYPLEETFRLSADVGYDGLEVMVIARPAHPDKTPTL